MRHQVPEHPVFRAGSVDREIWSEAIELNTYRLPALFAPGEWVLNIGAHTGSVAWRCAFSGARVVAVEPSRDNYHLLLHNTRPVWDRVLPVHAAAWRSDQPATTLRFEPNWCPANTGGGCVLGDAGGQGHDVLALPLDDLLRLRPEWRLLVIDAEGSEFATLYTATLLGRVHEIAGEFHERGTDVRPYADTGRPYLMMHLAAHLEEQGFHVEVKSSGPGMGLFWARRN